MSTLQPQPGNNPPQGSASGNTGISQLLSNLQQQQQQPGNNPPQGSANGNTAPIPAQVAQQPATPTNLAPEGEGGAATMSSTFTLPPVDDPKDWTLEQLG